MAQGLSPAVKPADTHSAGQIAAPEQRSREHHRAHGDPSLTLLGQHVPGQSQRPKGIGPGVATQGNDHRPQGFDPQRDEDGSTHCHRHAEPGDALQETGKQPAKQENGHQLILGTVQDQPPYGGEGAGANHHLIEEHRRPDGQEDGDRVPRPFGHLISQQDRGCSLNTHGHRSCGQRP